MDSPLEDDENWGPKTSPVSNEKIIEVTWGLKADILEDVRPELAEILRRNY